MEINRSKKIIAKRNVKAKRQGTVEVTQMAGHGVPFKTRFPGSRIKKIMQVDEEVGKLAQSTPIVVSKAVELFLEELVNRLVQVASDSDSQKIRNITLKHVVMNTAEYDFLKDLVQGISEQAAGVDEGTPNRSSSSKRSASKVQSPSVSTSNVTVSNDGTPSKKQKISSQTPSNAVDMDSCLSAVLGEGSSSTSISVDITSSVAKVSSDEE